MQVLFKKTFSSPVDRDFPELRLHDQKYDPLIESLHNYYFHKIQLCHKVNPTMPDHTIISHILKDLPASWNCQILANMDLKLEKLLPVLQNLDDEQRRLTTTSNNGITLDQMKEVIASEIKKVTSNVVTHSECSSNSFQDNASRAATPIPEQNRVICQICNKPGHTADRCFRRFSSLNSNNFQSGNSGFYRPRGNYARGGYYGSNYSNSRGSANGFTQGAQYFRSPNPHNNSFQGFQPRFNQFHASPRPNGFSGNAE